MNHIGKTVRLLERLALLRVRPAPALGHVHGKGCYFGVLAPSALSSEAREATDASAVDAEPKMEHRQGRDCWCLPTVQQYEHADVVIHNDGDS